MEHPDEPHLPPLERRQVVRLFHAMSGWVSRHPRPNEPLISFPDTGFVSPLELTVAVGAEAFSDSEWVGRGGSDLGRLYLDSLRWVLLEIPFETYLASVERSATPRFRPLRPLFELSSRLSARRRVAERPTRAASGP